ncbi:MAG: alpha/beta hydrolase [Nitrospinae bacterium]|nr:alpha/beta hydrolase [Nitrospinota bacterium]
METFKVKRAVIKVNGLNLFYRDTVSNNQPILCLHGKWGRGETWTDFMLRYKDRYRIIAPDQRGHGLSDKPAARYAGEDFAADAYELIKHLKLDTAIVVGHSLGGRNAAYLAALYPQAVKSLIILDTQADGSDRLSDITPDKVSPTDKFTADWPTPYSTYEEAIRDISKRFGAETNVRYFIESLFETVEGYDFLFSRYAMSAIDVYYQRWYHILKQIKCPILFIRAKDSWYLSEKEADKIKTFMNNYTYFEVSSSDHMVYADNPDEFYPIFDQFLKKYGQ